MKTISIVLITIAINTILGSIASGALKKSKKRDEELFIFKIEHTLANKSISLADRKEKAMKLCRESKLDIAHGVYIALKSLNE